MNEALWQKVEAVLAQGAKEDLMGATLRGDRQAMREAADALAAFVPRGERHGVMSALVRHLLLVAGGFTGVPAKELADAVDLVEHLADDVLETYAVNFARLAYGTTDSATVN